MGRPKVCHMRFVSPDMLPAHVPRHHWRPPDGNVPRHAVAGSGWGILGIFHSGHEAYSSQSLERNACAHDAPVCVVQVRRRDVTIQQRGHRKLGTSDVKHGQRERQGVCAVRTFALKLFKRSSTKSSAILKRPARVQASVRL